MAEQEAQPTVDIVKNFYELILFVSDQLLTVSNVIVVGLGTFFLLIIGLLYIFYALFFKI
jgi:hypothetical protein